jgi:signal transduction histidine kinase
VGILLGLRLLGAGGEERSELLRQAYDELGRAIDDLRELSHGLYPSVLGDEGLAAALQSLAETTRLTVGAVPSRRFPSEIEATAYLVVARAAASGVAWVDAVLDTESLAVRVVARSPFEPADLVDRVAALGGRMVSELTPAGTTVVTLELPG